jgi:activator of 2-hydroxyglutaryl-CoA dehydratase/predicted nucleotide-binding protein (sugar kinase/HSP70/actin superfamily)
VSQSHSKASNGRTGPGGDADAGLRVAGVDLGKSTLKLVVLRVDPALPPRIERWDQAAHEGSATALLSEWYERHDLASCAALGATGLYGDELVAPVIAGLPERACLEEALPILVGSEGPVHLVSIGARGYAALSRDAQGRVQHAESDKCSAGTGETIVKTASRFGCSAPEADRLACNAAEAIPITARCSVFAKSEMTHFGNQGKPADALFRGYFDSIARYVAALVERIRVPGPVYLIGGCSRYESLRRGLSTHLGVEVVVPEHAPLFEAVGAARIAGQQAEHGRMGPLPASADGLTRTRERRFQVLPSARDFAHRVTVMRAPPIPDGAARAPAILGLDLGSTGSKAVLTSIHTGDIALLAYDRTRGNPVEAAQRLVRTLLEGDAPDVRAIGLTGSGREAAATVLRAAFPDAADRIVVVNEIVAHATAAIRCDEDGGESLSIVEIGGQDAKFAQVTNGQIVESDMNKACSAGTGSFLEEQAVFHGVHDIGEFTRLATEATRPPDLGQMCTVFVAEAAAEAHREGFGVADLFAGFQYSVIHNYLNRVMGQRTFGKRIFFQGKPASGPSLAWTLAAVSEREVVVPPHPGEMGAWGIGLCARDALGCETLLAATPLGLEAFLGAEVVRRAEFRCKDSRCNTLCHIDRTTVALGRSKHTVLSGGACPKFEVATATKPKLPQDAPSAFDEREALLAPLRERSGHGPPIAVPEAGSLAGFIPWAVTLLRGLGLDPYVLRSNASTLPTGEARCYSYDACAPAKVAHGLLDGQRDGLVFWPKVLDHPDRDGRGGRTCPMEQAMPDMVRHALGARGEHPRVEAPVLSLGADPAGAAVVREVARMATRLGVDPSAAPRAVRRAADAQRAHERELAHIGERTLAYGRDQGLAVIVVCGSLHVIHESTLNANIPGILRQSGVLALPMDCYPVPAGVDPLPRAVWGDANRALRVGLAARERGGVYPLYLASFGCGPASFVEQIFDMLLGGYPHTALETDGHGGTAGYVTRIQAFLHGVRQHDGSASPTPPARLDLVAPLPHRPLEQERDARLVVLPIGDRLGAMAAASFRSIGYDAVTAGPNSAETLALGRRDCSGKECLPYQLIWGAFRSHLENAPPEERTVLVQVQGQGACRNCMFSVKDRMSIEHLGASDRVSVRHMGGERAQAFFTRFWASTVAWDILNQLAAYHRPLATDPARVDGMHAQWCDALEALTERPQQKGLGALLDGKRQLRAVGELLDGAARQYARLASHAPPADGLRTVLVTGDIYLRIDAFSSADIVRLLNERGLRVIVDPTTTMVEYLTEAESAELLGLPTGALRAGVTRVLAKRIKGDFYERVRRLHPWLPVPDVRTALSHADPLMGRDPFGEAPITVGTVMQAWHERICDGVVVLGPWGCGPALISESILRHQRQVPLHFFYGDGSPMDERRLNAFAYRLQREPPRTAPHAAVARTQRRATVTER